MKESSSISDIHFANSTTYEEFRIKEEEEVLSCLAPGRKCSGISEVYLLIQKNYKEKEKLRKESAKLEHQQDKTLAALASEIFDLGRFWSRLQQKIVEQECLEELKGLEIILKRMWSVLDERQVEILDLTGMPVSDELLKTVEVLKYVREPGTVAPIIKETKMPVIRCKGRLIQTGEVIATVGDNED